MTIRSVSYSGRTLTAPGVIERPEPGMPDLYWPGGDGVVLLNGHRSKPVERVKPEKHVTVQADHDGNLGSSHTLLVDLPFATGRPLCFDDGPRMSRLGDQSHNPYLAGCDLASAPLDALRAVTGWGDAAVDTESAEGGSKSLVAMRHPAAMAALILAHHGIEADPSDGRRRVIREWAGGYHVYDIIAPDPDSTTQFAPFLRWWRSESKADGCLFQGYNKSTGGFSTLFGAKRPPGITWASSGLRCPEQDHAAIDTPAIYAALTGDLIALADARCGLESLVSAMRYETSTGGRGLGHVIRGCAVTWGSCLLLSDEEGAERCSEVMDFLLDEAEKRRCFGLAGSFAPFLDRGNSTDSYHLNPMDVEWLVSLLAKHGALDRSREETTKILARSTTIFMAGIFGSAAVLALELLDPVLSKHQRERLWDAAETTVAFLTRQGGAPAIVAPDARLAWPDGPLWDDVRRLDQEGLHPALAGLMIAEGHSKSVAPRFVTPALLGYARMTEHRIGTAQVQLRKEALELAGRIREAWGPWKAGGSELAGALETGEVLGGMWP